MSKEDWRSRAAYQYAATMEPASLAWEFLRRNPDYRSAYEAAPAQADDGTDGPAPALGVAISWLIQTGAPINHRSSGGPTNWRRSSS